MHYRQNAVSSAIKSSATILRVDRHWWLKGLGLTPELRTTFLLACWEIGGNHHHAEAPTYFGVVGEVSHPSISVPGMQYVMLMAGPVKFHTPRTARNPTSSLSWDAGIYSHIYSGSLQLPKLLRLVSIISALIYRYLVAPWSNVFSLKDVLSR